MLKVINKKEEMSLQFKNDYDKILKDETIPKYILGINKYAESLHLFLIRNHITFSGFIDDFTDENEHLNVKIETEWISPNN